jgi:hypothetical protein
MISYEMLCPNLAPERTFDRLGLRRKLHILGLRASGCGIGNEATRVHRRDRGCRVVAARGTRVAVGDAGDRNSLQWFS